MDEVESPHLTAQQTQWFKSLREGLSRDTGRTLEEWVEIARTCPETAHRAKLKWFKDNWGLLQNRASLVLNEADLDGTGWREPASLRDALWIDMSGRHILDRLEAVIGSFDPVIAGQRKSFSAWSRRSQFAALRPRKPQGAVLGLAVPLEASPGLMARGRESWSERLKSKLELSSADDVKQEVERLLRAAWANS